MIPDDESLEFLIEHLKSMIQEQPDRKIEKISDLTEILSDFMSTFLVVVDALISSSQRRFGAIEHKLNEFEDLLLSASIKGLSGLSEVTEKEPIREASQPVHKPRPIPSREGVHPPPPPPKVPTEEPIPITQSTEPPGEKTTEAISEDMEVEDLAAFAFKQREKVTVPSPQPSPARLGAVSLKMELMQELKKKFGSEKFIQIDSK